MPDTQHAFRLLLRLHLLALRRQVLALTLYTLVLPLGFIAALAASPLPATPIQRTDLVALSPELPLLGMAFLVIPPLLAQMRERGQLRFFATLPIHRGVLLRAMLAAAALAVLPGTILAPLWAADLVQRPAPFTVLFGGAIVVVALPLAPLGACIGLSGLRQAAATAWGFVLYGASVGAVILLATTPHLATSARKLAFILPGAAGSDLLAAFLPLSGSRGVLGDLALVLVYTAGAGFLAWRLVPWRRAEQSDPVPQPNPVPALSHPADAVGQSAD
jgi:hypothetical protein